jgi:predicted enzyme related to lactoylglutathione lyase
MVKSIFFDHIEVHVKDIPKYCRFLKKVFGAGRYKVIAPNGTSMFKTKEGLNIEIKKQDGKNKAASAGFCNPGLRMKGAKEFIEKTLKLKITKASDNPDGKCYFFKDHEGVTWHIKDYLVKDKFINW